MAANEGDRRDLAGRRRLQHGFSRLQRAAGAVALSVIFGVGHFLPAVLIFVSAGAGAILRRALAQLSGNYFIQAIRAAILAGLSARWRSATI